MKLDPFTPVLRSPFPRLPLALARHLDSRAIDEKVYRLVRLSHTKVHFQASRPSRQGGVGRAGQAEFQQGNHIACESFGGSQSQLEENLEGKDGLDGEVAVGSLLVWKAVAFGFPSGGDFGGNPEGDSTPIDQGGVILFPVAGAIRRFVLFHSLRDCQNRTCNYLAVLMGTALCNKAARHRIS